MNHLLFSGSSPRRPHRGTVSGGTMATPEVGVNQVI
jgi:hypothetical protein